MFVSCFKKGFLNPILTNLLHAHCGVDRGCLQNKTFLKGTLSSALVPTSSWVFATVEWDLVVSAIEGRGHPNMPTYGLRPPPARRATSWRSPYSPPWPTGASPLRRRQGVGRRGRPSGAGRGPTGGRVRFPIGHPLFFLHFFSSSLKCSGGAIFHLAPHPLPQAQD